ncbi:GSCFA domain-containing protein [Hymenobacter sp. IS2118]|uniref:GSCFA domain-containing protein n=1 Tax=Hymenobacter sp. IS2118 TaxID=1505605 RepID=UPI00068E44A7|nr:GSCFA domain-containing protein [Hymenobacter sp. IS2118]
MFRTEIPIAPATDQLARTAQVLTVGSCFADSIGARLAANKVKTLVNPFGTVFQPLALARLLRAAAGEDVDWQQHLVYARGRWQSYDLHGSIGADSPVDLLLHIQELVRRTGDFLRQADVVLLTLGTAWTYRLRETGELVNNCHKQPADLFVKELLTPDEVINALAETHAYLRRINPNLRFVVTVSPVRHLKDTLPLNSVSKSVLRLATHIVSDLLPGVAYFPAYELLVDDLRDYRFYASDMLHPSEVAEEYVWDKFARTYFDADFGRFRKEWAAVRQSLGHRPLHEGAPEHRQFLVNTMEKLEQLSLRRVEVTTELNDVRARIMALPVPKQPEPVVVLEDDEERVDIGEDAGPARTDVATAPLMPPAALVEGRPPRLSPEEFRAQRAARPARPERGRRDGRGKGQPQTPSENEQFQVAASLVQDQSETTATDLPVVFVPSELSQAEESLEQAANNEAGTDETAKKKKRRSRGGAKRTARKNALRLAAGETMPEDESGTGLQEANADDLGTTASDQSEDHQTPGTNPAPVQRGGRRNETGRVQRKELFAAGSTAAPDSAISAEDVAAVSAANEPQAEAPATALDAPAAAPQKSRNNRNRGRKGSGPAGDGAATGTEAPRPVIETSPATNGNAEDLSGAVEATDAPARNRNQRGNQPAATEAAAAPAETAVSAEAPAAAPARRSNRAKRAVSGARAEKPAVDTPVIPVADALQLRTQVAAGRMTGSSASLIEPDAPVKAPAKRTPATKVAPAENTLSEKVPAPKKMATKKTVAPTPVPEAKPTPPVAEVKAPEKAPTAKKPASAAKPKPVAKPKATPAAKPEAKPTAKAKPVAKPKAKPAAKAKPVASEKPVAAKPKAPRKPAKPA